MIDCILGLQTVHHNTQHTATVYSLHAGSCVDTALWHFSCHTAATTPCDIKHNSHAYACSNTGKPFLGTELLPQHD